MRLYKVLKVRGRTGPKFAEYYFSPYQQFDYGQFLPENGKPGRWTPKLRSHPLVCKRGWHLTTAPRSLIRSNMGVADKLPSGIVYEVYVAEGRGMVHREQQSRALRTKLAFQSIRLLKRASPYWETPVPIRYK